MNKTIALIPARGGSKGIPLKNIYLIDNKPMINYCLEAIKKSIVDEIYVSTDNSRIKSISFSCGAKVIDRPPELASDSSPTIDCVKHAINFLDLKENTTILLVQPTSPLIRLSDINKGLETFNSNFYDAVISVVKEHKIIWELNKDILVPKNHELKKRIRRQDMNKTFSETGAFYIFSVKNIVQNNSIYGSGNVGYVEIPKSRSFEVDDYEDIKIIELIIKNENSGTTIRERRIKDQNITHR